MNIKDFAVILKMWSINDRQIKLEGKMNLSENNVKESFNKIKKDIYIIKDKIGV